MEACWQRSWVKDGATGTYQLVLRGNQGYCGGGNGESWGTCGEEDGEGDDLDFGGGVEALQTSLGSLGGHS